MWARARASAAIRLWVPVGSFGAPAAPAFGRERRGLVIQRSRLTTSRDFGHAERGLVEGICPLSQASTAGAGRAAFSKGGILYDPRPRRWSCQLLQQPRLQHVVRLYGTAWRDCTPVLQRWDETWITNTAVCLGWMDGWMRCDAQPEIPSRHQRHMLQPPCGRQSIPRSSACIVKRSDNVGGREREKAMLPICLIQLQGYAGLDDVVRQSKISLGPGRYYRDHCYREQYQ
ncbi:hypothetical protein J3F84DRAFT_177277 [Trichoderma pleuroticola]